MSNSSPSSPSISRSSSSGPRTPSSASSPPRSPSQDPPQPPPYFCDDHGHCGAIGNPQCDIFSLRNCPGLPGGRTQPSYAGNIIHPANQVITCGSCRQHDNAFVAPNYHTMWQKVIAGADTIQYSGFLNQLCHTCIREEMELYWARQGTPQPQGARLSSRHVAHWPALPNDIQDLCVCRNRAIQRYHNHCHSCRDIAFRVVADDKYTHAEDILREHTRPVINGTRRCTINGGTAHHLIGVGRVNARVAAGFGRYCPCGNRPKLPAPAGQEYICICLACMGVLINPANLPARYQQANVQPRRRSPRNHPTGRTKGPLRAVRRAQFRVNIERGWVPNDRYVRNPR